MKILYVAEFFPHGTASYVETEIRAAKALGVEIHVWSMDATSGFPHPTSGPVHSKQSLASCIAAVRPDLVHAYYLSIGARVMEEVRAAGLPFTMRAHGFEFSAELLNRLASDPAVSRVVLFPHLAGDIDPALRKKVAVLPTMYNAEFFRPGSRRDRRLVVRLASAVRSKNIEHFFRMATLCPDYRFVLAVGEGFDFNFAATAHFKAVNESFGNPVDIRQNLDWPAAARLLGEAGIYVYTLPTHRPGMAISVAEAMASGCFVVAPDIEGMREYVGPACGRLYGTPEEAAALIRSTESWSDAKWRGLEKHAATHAARYHSNRVLAPKLVAIWRQAIGDAAPSRSFGIAGLLRRVRGQARMRA